MTHQHLTALGFQHRKGDNSYTKPLEGQFSLEVHRKKVFLVADAQPSDIASIELTESFIHALTSTLSKLKL